METPYGWTQQTSTAQQPLNAQPAMAGNPMRQMQRQQQRQQPQWYNGLLRAGANQYADNGGMDPAGVQSGANWFKNYYGGYTGGIPVQQGLLGAAAQNLAGSKTAQRMGLTPQQSYGLANGYLGQYAQNGVNGNLQGNGSLDNGFEDYLSGLGYGNARNGNRGLLG